MTARKLAGIIFSEGIGLEENFLPHIADICILKFHT